MKKRIFLIILLLSILITFMACMRKSLDGVEDNYWQTEPKLAMVLNDNIIIKDTIHYEETTIDENKFAKKKVLHSSDMDLFQNEIVAYRETSDEKVVIIVFDETYSTGFISKDTFKENFTTDTETMI